MAAVSSNIICRSILVQVLLVSVLTSTAIALSGRNVPGCEDETKALVDLCSKYVLKTGPNIRPAKNCCALVREVDVNCICTYATKEVAKLISMHKVFYVASTCGRKLPRIKKCGSIGIGSG
ncbi:hypothetical protein MKW98_027237 [Papaver atlanticum]|uniref:Bifunctional inhibitor/plant lipid transfer protein/seed storage helical domain-containing protein n=1 Tax=Papaver atlanticum TaxID=357466 RepID=A0AAD4SPI9_9MAGN|nr:hypothetical protein MKW98_027237 [Papaver atlanticum]